MSQPASSTPIRKMLRVLDETTRKLDTVRFQWDGLQSAPHAVFIIPQSERHPHAGTRQVRH
jgi:hypothetical protein